MKRKLFVSTALIMITVVLLSGCGSMKNADNSSISQAEYNYSGDYATSEEATAGYDTIGKNESISDANGVAPATATDGTTNNNTVDQGTLGERKLIYRENLTVETLEFDVFTAYAQSQTKTYGGYIEASSESGIGINSEGTNNRTASFTLRVPSKYLEEFVSQIGTMANIIYSSGTSEDVTLAYVDNQTHMDSLKIEQERLLELLEKAQTIDEIIQLESRLSQVRYEIEYYGSILRNYDNLVEYSTIYLSVTEVERITDIEVDSTFERMVSGLKNSLYSIKEGAVNFSVWFVVSLPYLLIWAVVILIAVVIIKKINKKSRNKRPQYNQPTINIQKAPVEEQPDNKNNQS